MNPQQETIRTNFIQSTIKQQLSLCMFKRPNLNRVKVQLHKQKVIQKGSGKSVIELNVYFVLSTDLRFA